MFRPSFFAQIGSDGAAANYIWYNEPISRPSRFYEPSCPAAATVMLVLFGSLLPVLAPQGYV
jgi:hypothetical protein